MNPISFGEECFSLEEIMDEYHKRGNGVRLSSWLSRNNYIVRECAGFVMKPIEYYLDYFDDTSMTIQKLTVLNDEGYLFYKIILP